MKYVQKCLVLFLICLFGTFIVSAQISGGNKPGTKDKKDYDKASLVFIDAVSESDNEYRIIEYKIYPPCGDQDFVPARKFALFAEKTDGTVIRLQDSGVDIEDVHTVVIPPVDAFPSHEYAQLTGDDTNKIFVKSIINGRNETIARNWQYHNIFMTTHPEKYYTKIVGVNIWNPSLRKRNVGLNIYYAPPILIIPDGKTWGEMRYRVYRSVNGGAETVIKTIEPRTEQRGAFIVDDEGQFDPGDTVNYRVVREVAFTNGTPGADDWEPDKNNRYDPIYEVKRNLFMPEVHCALAD